MNEQFFEHPILNSPYDYPVEHWELDAQGQPTQKILEKRRRAEFITPIPKPKKGRGNPRGRPNTLLIDSEQLESGDALDKNFRNMAADEIDRFRREIVERTGDRQPARWRLEAKCATHRLLMFDVPECKEKRL